MNNFALTIGVLAVLTVTATASGFYFDGADQLTPATDAEQTEHVAQVLVLTIVAVAFAVLWSVNRERRIRRRLDAEKSKAQSASFD